MTVLVTNGFDDRLLSWSLRKVVWAQSHTPFTFPFLLHSFTFHWKQYSITLEIEDRSSDGILYHLFIIPFWLDFVIRKGIMNTNLSLPLSLYHFLSLSLSFKRRGQKGCNESDPVSLPSCLHARNDVSCLDVWIDDSLLNMFSFLNPILTEPEILFLPISVDKFSMQFSRRKFHCQLCSSKGNTQRHQFLVLFFDTFNDQHCRLMIVDFVCVSQVSCHWEHRKQHKILDTPLFKQVFTHSMIFHSKCSWMWKIRKIAIASIRWTFFPEKWNWARENYSLTEQEKESEKEGKVRIETWKRFFLVSKDRMTVKLFRRQNSGIEAMEPNYFGWIRLE